MPGSARRQIIDRGYLIHEQLGEGGMGTVYRATQLGRGLQVALKLVKLAPTGDNENPSATDDATKQRLALAREFETLASLHHPNVIRVLSYGFDDELGSYYTMELLTAPKTIVQAAAAEPLENRLLLLGQLLRALSYIHRRGILHRDIKPKNIAPICLHREMAAVCGLRTACGLIG